MAGRIKYLTALVILFLTCLAGRVFAHYQQAKFSPSDANADDSFGFSVAIEGDLAVVGAWQNDSNGPDSGAVYVYEFSGDAWTQKQKLIASDGNDDDRFGRSVAIEGNTIVVGSYYDDNAGSAYIFDRSAGVWSQQQKLIASDANADDRFGCDVSISSDTIVVGAYGDDNHTGSAYVFIRAGSTWTFQQKLTAPDVNGIGWFGYSVAIDINTILIGAHYKSPFGINYAGAVYFFTRSAEVWSQQSVLTASDAKACNYFGCSVAFDGNFAVIGAYECDINGIIGAGAAYVFNRTETGWVEQQKLFDISPGQAADFGRTVAIEANTIFVGCPYYLVDGNRAGAVFEFVRNGDTWVRNNLLTADDPDTDDTFGLSLALSGQYLITGAPYNYYNGKSSGSAYIFNNAPPADFDGDSDVDFADFAALADSWLQNDPLRDIAPPPAGDGIVDIYDLAVLCDNWLAGK